jgi:hypothetical protein
MADTSRNNPLIAEVFNVLLNAGLDELGKPRPKSEPTQQTEKTDEPNGATTFNLPGGIFTRRFKVNPSTGEREWLDPEPEWWNTLPGFRQIEEELWKENWERLSQIGQQNAFPGLAFGTPIACDDPDCIYCRSNKARFGNSSSPFDADARTIREAKTREFKEEVRERFNKIGYRIDEKLRQTLQRSGGVRYNAGYSYG